MIGSGTIGSYGSHEHTVTKCLHETHGITNQRGGAAPGGSGTAAAKPAEAAQNVFSLTDMLSDGWKGLVSKTSGIWGRIWGDGTESSIRGDEPDRAVLAEGQSGITEAAAIAGKPAAGQVPQEVLASALQADAAARAQAAAAGDAAAVKKTAVQSRHAGTAVHAVKDAESKGEGMSGGMPEDMENETEGKRWKSRKYVKKFLREFGKPVTGRTFGAKEESEREEEDILPEGGITSLGMGQSSYLLDSYNRSGEYSTLAKDHSLEGSFRALG